MENPRRKRAIKQVIVDFFIRSPFYPGTFGIRASLEAGIPNGLQFLGAATFSAAFTGKRGQMLSFLLGSGFCAVTASKQAHQNCYE